MPIYEYECTNCSAIKELIRGYDQLHEDVWCWKCRENWEQPFKMEFIISRSNPLWMDQIVTDARKEAAKGDAANKDHREQNYWNETARRQRASAKVEAEKDKAADTNWKKKTFYPNGSKR